MRPDRAQKVETNLVVQQEVFERAYSTILNGLKYMDKKGMEVLRNIHSETEGQRKRELENLQKSLLAMAMVIQKLKHNIKNEKFVEEHDTEYFRKHLISIEDNLKDFKSLLSEQLQTLQDEETDLQQSIDALNQRLNEESATKIQEGNSFTRTVRARAKSRVQSSVHENVHPDVKEFHQFLQNNGGHTGGWDTKDHLIFTRFLQKYRGLDQMTTALLDLMPDKTPEEIAQHESWYHDYLTLKDAQRRALRDWREEQSSQKQRFDLTGNESLLNDSPTPSYSRKNSQRDPAIKEKIKLWKEKQKMERQQQLEQLHDKKKREEETWRKKVAYFEQQRRIIAERRREHQELLASKGYPTPDTEAHISTKQIPLKDFWEQDKLFMLRRQSRLQRSSARHRSRSGSRSTVHAERDPARLLRPTAVWQARVRRSLSEDNSKQQSTSLYIADVPHLAVPKWREGIF